MAEINMSDWLVATMGVDQLYPTLHFLSLDKFIQLVNWFFFDFFFWLYLDCVLNELDDFFCSDDEQVLSSLIRSKVL